jgi:DNA-binding GntR family transcriptional regulator
MPMGRTTCAIRSCRSLTGQRIRGELSDVTGISRIPIREACGGAAEGLSLASSAGRPEVIARRPRQVFGAIALGSGAMLAVAKATERGSRISPRHEQNVRRGRRPSGRRRRKRGLHDLLVKMSHNDVLQSMLKPLRSVSRGCCVRTTTSR